MDVVRAAWAERLGLTRGMALHLCDADMDQLSHCRSDEARRILVASMRGKKTTTGQYVYRHMPPQFRRTSRKMIATPGQLNQIALNWEHYGADALVPLLGVSRTLVRRWAREAGLPKKTGARRGVPILRVRGIAKRPVVSDPVARMMELVERMCIIEAYGPEARSQDFEEGRAYPRGETRSTGLVLRKSPIPMRDAIPT